MCGKLFFEKSFYLKEKYVFKKNDKKIFFYEKKLLFETKKNFVGKNAFFEKIVVFEKNFFLLLGPKSLGAKKKNFFQNFLPLGPKSLGEKVQAPKSPGSYSAVPKCPVPKHSRLNVHA